MADVVSTEQVGDVPVAATPTKKGAAGKKAASGKARAKPSHPPTSEMVISAIKSLKERGGSSLQAIKKYIGANYKVDAEKMSPFIKKYLKSAVVSGTLVQPKGKGASGSFKLAVVSTAKSGGEKISPAKASDTKAAPKKKTTTASRAKASTGTAKTASPKKQPVKKSAKAAKSKTVAKRTVAKKAASEPKNPPKMKATKGPTKKPKVPKPKTAKKAAASPKKATSKRR